MSKGNLFMGFGRGKVGSVVLARSKGQQVARAYNDAPKNPRSEGQMLQRSLFASAVKFFTQGRQAFYQFAFENKSSKQSDYNAFVSANAKRGMNISKAAFEEATYPVLAPWMMSKGSLPELELEYNTEINEYRLSIPGLVNGANMGELSQALIAAYGLNAGDIITVVTINAQGSTASNTPDVNPEKRQMIKWDIKQAVLDVSSTSGITTLFGLGAVAGTDAITFKGITSINNASGACITVSRVTEEGLKVNDSYLVLNSVANTILSASKERGYIDQVLVSWKTSGKAILEGSLVQEGSTPAIYRLSVFADQACTERPLVGDSYTKLYVKVNVNQEVNEVINFDEGASDFAKAQITAPSEEYPEDSYSISLYQNFGSAEQNVPFTEGSVVEVANNQEITLQPGMIVDFQ